MSDIFIKENIDDLITSIESDNLAVPAWINSIGIKNIENNNYSETSEFSIKNNENLSSTSDIDLDLPLDSDFNSEIQESNVSPTSDENVNFDTELLSATSNNNIQNGGSEIFVNNNNSDYDKSISSSPDEINNLINMLTSDDNEKNFDTEISLTDTEDLENKLKSILALQSGGKKSHKNEHETKKKRKANPAIMAFGDLCKHIANKLGVPNGVPVKKIGGQVNRDMKEKEPGLDPVKNAEKAKKLFDDNIEKYKKLLA